MKIWGRKGRLSIELISSRPLEKNPGIVLLSHALERSTIAAEVLHCRVRDGNGCYPLAMNTGNKKDGRAVLPGAGHAAGQPCLRVNFFPCARAGRMGEKVVKPHG